MSSSPLHNSARSARASARTHGLDTGDLLRWIAKEVKVDPKLGNNRELLRWAALLPHVRNDQEHLIKAAECAIRIVVSRRNGWRGTFRLWRLRRSVERNVLTRCPAFYLLRGLGILIGLATVAVVVTWISVKSHNEVLGLNSKHLALVALAGVTGSIVSLLTRVPEFAKRTRASRLVLEAVGFCKPLIGTAFALFGYTVLTSHIIPLSPDLATTPSAIAVLGFVAAFSERFIPDMIFRTEGQLGGGRRRRSNAHEK